MQLRLRHAVFYSVMRLMISVSNFPNVFFFCSWYPKAAQTEIVNTTQMVSGLQKEAQGFCLAAFLHDVIRRQVESRQTKLRVCYWLVLCYHLSQFQLPVVATSFPITLAMSTVVHSQAIEERRKLSGWQDALCSHCSTYQCKTVKTIQTC